MKESGVKQRRVGRRCSSEQVLNTELGLDGVRTHAAAPPLLGGTYSARLYSLTYSDLLVCGRGSSHVPLLTHLM